MRTRYSTVSAFNCRLFHTGELQDLDLVSDSGACADGRLSVRSIRARVRVATQDPLPWGFGAISGTLWGLWEGLLVAEGEWATPVDRSSLHSASSVEGGKVRCHIRRRRRATRSGANWFPRSTSTVTWAAPTLRPLIADFQIQLGLVRSRGCGNWYKYLSFTVYLP